MIVKCTPLLGNNGGAFLNVKINNETKNSIIIVSLQFKHKKNVDFSTIISNGAGDRNRTCTPKVLDPKSSASASSATPAWFVLLHDINGDPYGVRTRKCMRERHVC